MNVKKFFTLALAVLMTMLAFSSCQFSTGEATKEGELQINPIPESVNKEQVSTRLYFGYLTEQLLVGENRSFDVPDTDSREKSIIEQLIMGPSVVRTDFVQLINPNTKVVNVSVQGQFLIVTLSKEFLDPLVSNIDPVDDEQIYNEKVRKYLAVYSIVNTIIEQGTYSRVSILIDEDGGARPLTQTEAGLEGGSEPTDTFERNGAIELDARNTMREILSVIEKKDWNMLYGYIAYKNSNGQDKPSIEDFRNEITASKLSVSNYEILEDVMAQDGKSDVVMINYDLKLLDSETRTLSNIPVRLTQERDVWKITYNVFKSKFLS